MRDENFLIKKFGDNEYGFADLPEKISNIVISRFKNIHDGDYGEIFPHRYCYWNLENDRFDRQRCWKKYRNTQWKG